MAKIALNTAMLAIVATAGLTACAAPPWSQRYVVAGVEEDDLLKLRAGPGTGYDVIVGMPNGTTLLGGTCTQTGATRWCEVSLERDPSLTGYASTTYLDRL